MTHDPDGLLDVLEREGVRAARRVEDGDPDRPVPGCPGLTAGETARHLGSVYRMAVVWIRTGARPASWDRTPRSGEPVGDYLRDGLRSLLGELAAHDPAEPCATWHPHDQTYGFWRRRMAHESTVHRVDIEDGGAVEEEVAVDGVDEVLSLWFVHRLSALGVAGTRRASVAVRTGGRSWLATVDGSGTRAAESAPTAPSDAVISASPSDMYLWLWGRRPVCTEAVVQRGDLDASAQLWALLRLATR